MMMNSLKLILLVFLLGQTGCSGLLEKIMKEPKVEIDRVEIRNPELTKANLVFVLKVSNPNSFQIKVDQVSYKVFLGGEHFAETKTSDVVPIKANSDTMVELPLVVEYNKLLKGIGSLLQDKALNYKIEGDAKISALTLPFKEEGKVEL